MAFDNALHFLDDLKDKYLHEVEKAIDDWDYQDFSPDKRTPLLENEIVGDVAADDDVQPEANALQQIKKDAQALNWSGLSRDEMLNEQAFGRLSTSGSSITASVAASTTGSYEARVVAMVTPVGGVQGIPDSDATQRFLQHAPMMNPPAVADAFVSRLQQTTWQIRSKALVVMEMLLESPDLVAVYLRAFVGNAALVPLIDVIRTRDHNAIVRENARKVLSLIRSNGASATLVAREHVAAKPHVRHAPTAKKPQQPLEHTAAKPKPRLTVHTTTTNTGARSPVKKTGQDQGQHHYQSTSPKIAAAALASWRRRSQKELLGAGATSGTAMPPPAPLSPNSLKSSGDAGLWSGVTLADQPKSLHRQQQRMTITASRTHSFR